MNVRNWRKADVQIESASTARAGSPEARKVGMGMCPSTSNLIPLGRGVIAENRGATQASIQRVCRRTRQGSRCRLEGQGILLKPASHMLPNRDFWEAVSRQNSLSH